MAVTKVVMPKLSDAMETGKIIKWLKKEGDRIAGGDILAEVETDKADVEMEAFGAGVLRKILVPAGERAPVGTLIAVIAEPSEDIASVVSGAAAPAAPRDVPARVAATMASPAPGPQRLKASPLAKKIAAQSGVDLRVVHGSGPGGRIIRRDVEAALSGGPAATPTRVMATATGPEYEDQPLTSIRAVIAKRMPLSKAPVPHFYVTTEVAMDRAWALREELNALEGQPKISVNDLIIRACALTLLHHPGVNASFQGESIRVFHRVHMGIAV